MFSSDTSPKNAVILENKLIDIMTQEQGYNNLEPIDNITLTSFVKKFNEKYDDTLSENQRTLLNLYITSFADNSLGLKAFLNEEIGNLKETLKENCTTEYFKEDSEMISKAEKVIELLESFKDRQINEELLIKILKTQALVQEIVDNGNND